MEFPALISRYQIQPYRGSMDKLNEVAIAFTGAPQQSNHPGKVLLLNDPTSRQSFFYEFRSEDIAYAEEGTTISLPDGSSVTTVTLWIKKGATALKIEPFHVEDTAQGLNRFFSK